MDSLRSRPVGALQSAKDGFNSEIRATGDRMTAPMSKKGKVTAVPLLVSALLGIAILGTDQNLSQYQPTHVYGLAAFVVIDLVLAGLVLMKGTKLTLRIAGLWGLVQALVMLSDITTTNPFGNSFPISQTDFARYLFGLAFYDTKHIAYLFPLLFAVNLLVLIVAMMEARKAS